MERKGISNVDNAYYWELKQSLSKFVVRVIILAAFIFGSSTNIIGAKIKLSGSASLRINSSVILSATSIENNSTGTILNNGTIELTGNIINNNGTLIDASSTGTIKIKGTSGQQTITGTSGCEFYGTVEINNTDGLAFTDDATGASQSIPGNLTFTQGKLTLNAFNLTLGANDPTGVGASAYIVTNSTGIVKRSVPGDGSTNVLYPIGNSAYNPVTLQNSAIATTDNYGIRVVDSKPGSFSGTTNIVDRSWIITEYVAGGSDLTVTTQWNSGEELTNFDRTKSMLGVTTDDGANVTWGTPAAAGGSDPYTQSISGITTLGTFMVGDEFYDGILLDLKIWLAGAYNTTNDNMDKTLNTEGLLPLTDPYSLSTTVSAVPTNAVDWVKIELRDKTDNTSVLYSFARFVDQDGQIIEENETNFKMKGVTRDSYYIAVLHRNHMGIISNSTIDLNGASPTLSFQSAQATAWQDGAITTNDAMKEVETGVFGLWDGDANADGEIQYEGSGPDRITILNTVGVSTPTNSISATYSPVDTNMDGNIQYEGGNPDRVSILNVVGVSTPTQSFTAHLP